MGRSLLDIISLSARHYIIGKISHVTPTELLPFVCSVPNPTPSLHKQSDNFNETTVSKVSRTGPTAQRTAAKPRNQNIKPENIPSHFYNTPFRPCERH